MIRNTVLSHSSLGVSKEAARITVVLSATFLVILFFLHFLEPEFDPAWRMISEYALGRYGWMMALAFFCWRGGVLALLVALWPSLRNVVGKIGRWWLLVISVALFRAGIFKTNATTDPPTSTANNLHTLCGEIVILTFPITATLVAGSLARNQAWAKARRRLLWGKLLVWVGQLALVPGGEHQPAELVGEGHEEIPTDARLQVFLGSARRGPLEGCFERGQDG